MEKNYTINVLILFPLIKIAEDNGISKHELMSSIGFNSDEINSPDARLTIKQFILMIQKIESKVKDHNIAFKTGEMLSAACTGIIGYMMINCRNIGHAIEKFCKYQEVAGDAVNVSIIKGKKLGKIVWKNKSEELEPYKKHILESLLSGTVNIGKELTGKILPINEVNLDYPEPPDISEYKRIFNAKLIFDQPETSIIFDIKHYYTPVLFSNPELLEMLENQADIFLKRLSENSKYTNQVVKILHDRKKLGYKIKDIAKEMAINVRSLQLHLKNEGSTFREIKDKVQTDIAKRFLNNESFSITEVSYLLGFSDASTFHRTFKRWTGITPGEYRSG